MIAAISGGNELLGKYRYGLLDLGEKNVEVVDFCGRSDGQDS